MKVVALVSGGKDSCYAMMKCIQYGHEIVALANLLPADDSVDELDSYMYQTVGHQIVVSYAKCMGVPLFRRRIQGSTRHQNLSYRMTQGDEVEDMSILLEEVKRQIPSITAVSSGAIASDYQRFRVENVCSRLGLVSLAYLWKQDQSLLLQEMVTNGIVAITVKVAAMGLDPAKHLGKEIMNLQSYLHKLNKLYGINVCGEGGEYETLTLDCPLFGNARIVLDEFQVVLHSSDSIAPVGILHPLAFHLENKVESISLSATNGTNDACLEKIDSVCEVQGDCLRRCAAKGESVDAASDLDDVIEHRLLISKTRKDNLFSMCCWLQDSSKTSSGLQEDMKAVLKKIESQLMEYGFGWENVLYIHLYISDMNEFALANEIYVKYITQEKCPLGVPSRSTIELPLLQVGLGGAYVEVLVTTDQSKRVLHVQSISCWAPSCIGPYSQATLHKGILHMAGQLGLDPPTMNLCSGGPTVELEQALINSDAVAKCFNCSVSNAAIIFVIYCSTRIPPSERIGVQDKLDTVLKQMRLFQENKGCLSNVLYPILLYVLVPDLPKRALVEVKPVLYVEDDMKTTETTVEDMSFTIAPNHWDFQEASWHDTCIQKSVIPGKICVIVLSVTNELAMKVCSESPGCNRNNQDHRFGNEQIDRITRFCIYLLDKVLAGNGFSWEDITNLKFYFPTSLCMPLETLSLMFTNAFNEFAEMSQRIKIGKEPIFNLIPVLGAGKTSSMDDIITCELFSQKH
ncbi:hypothetical protein VitviT2T_021477 [Vitis vinifera]|uniref:Diphthine--ammonia ligase n=2 Tax=Vitis vinifera TaxID=29760 RepID=A0ABY9D734_VITVI|eukprot:XP_002268271.1 PREDICTED: diphthine--ammonia ligase [Vitis vinifera]